MRIWVLQRFQTYGRICLSAGVLLAPVIWWRQTQDVFNLVKFTALWVTGVAAVVFYVSWAAERKVWIPRLKLLIPTIAFIGACVVATIFSRSPTLSLIGLYHRYGGLLPFALYATIMVLIVGLFWEKPGQLKDIARASAVASILLTTYVLIQAAGQDWIPWRDASGLPPEFPVGTMGNSNFAGGYLGIAVPFLVFVAATAKRDFVKTILFIVVGLDLLALWFTQTRGGMIAAGVGLTTMVFAYRDRLPRWLRIGTVIATAAAVAVAVFVLWHPGSDQPYGRLARIETLRTGTFNIRTYYWKAAIRTFKDHPVAGDGLELYYSNYTKYRVPKDGAQLGLTITDKPHNIYLEYAANAGILGIGTYLSLVGLGLWYGFRYSRRLDDPHRLLLVTFLAVLMGYLGQGVFSIDVPPLAVMGWIGLGGIAAIADPRTIAAREAALAAAVAERRPQGKKKRSSSAREARLARKGPARWAIHIPVTFAAVSLVALGMRPLLADIQAREGLNMQKVQGAEANVAPKYERAIKLHPLEAAYRSQAGAWAEARGGTTKDSAQKRLYFEQGLAYYKKALALQSGNVFYLMNIARVHTTWAEQIDSKRFPEADRWWQKAVASDPTDWAVHERYAVMLNSYANSAGTVEIRRRGAQQLEEVVRIRPDQLNAWINLGKTYRVLGETEKAKRALRKALELQPTNEEAKALLAAI